MDARNSRKKQKNRRKTKTRNEPNNNDKGSIDCKKNLNDIITTKDDDTNKIKQNCVVIDKNQINLNNLNSNGGITKTKALIDLLRGPNNNNSDGDGDGVLSANSTNYINNEERRQSQLQMVDNVNNPEEVNVSQADKMAKTKNLFLKCLEDKIGSLDNIDEDIAGFPTKLFGNLQKLFNQEPITDIETSDDDDEYVEYVYKPRKYFLMSICQHCKNELISSNIVPCQKCGMTFYCSNQHMEADNSHKELCCVLTEIANSRDGHIYRNCSNLTTEEFRSYRVLTVRKVETILKRNLLPYEQEILLFPRICGNQMCRETRYEKLDDCKKCGQATYCKENRNHLIDSHYRWCNAFDLFKRTSIIQERFGKIDPSLPSKILRDLPMSCNKMIDMLKKINAEFEDDSTNVTLTQIASGPLTVWYGLKLCGNLREADLTIHLIGAEIEFEVDVLDKWERFFLHITPNLKNLNVVFIGPELNPQGISLEPLTKTKVCKICRKNNRNIKYYFESFTYHEYCNGSTYLKPDIVCFFNPGLHRSTGFQDADTWPETIEAAAKKHCPVIVTSYTEYESPLDLTRFLHEAQRKVNIILPPTVNPFTSEKPERNFISDDIAPLMFKNYYCFIVE